MFFGEPLGTLPLGWFFQDLPTTLFAERFGFLSTDPRAISLSVDVRIVQLPIDYMGLGMSGFLNLEPPPFEMGAMAPVDTDTWSIDATANLAERSAVSGATVTITAVGAPTILRQDGAALDAGDITAVAQAPSSGGLAFLCEIQSNGNSGVYFLEYPLTLSVGGPITRTGKLRVLSFVG